MTPLITLNNVERSYNTAAGAVWVLRRINLEIARGEFLTIMGPSGAGKTSLLNVLALLDDEWRGEFTLDGNAIHQLRRKQRGDLSRRTFGMVVQSYHLTEDFTSR